MISDLYDPSCMWAGAFRWRLEVPGGGDRPRRWHPSQWSAFAAELGTVELHWLGQDLRRHVRAI